MVQDLTTLHLRRMPVSVYINWDKAWKGIKFGLALGEDEGREGLTRHYQMFETMEQVTFARQRARNNNRGNSGWDVEAMYSPDRMMTFVEVGGIVMLWDERVTRVIDGPEVQNFAPAEV